MEKDEKGIISFHDGHIRISGWHRRYLKGGLWDSKYVDYPLNEDNIEILFKYYGREMIWKPSIYQAIKEYVETNNKKEIHMKLLKKLTIDNIDGYPLFFEGKGGQFKNQRISQFWSKYNPSHAKLWEMGTGKTRASIEGYSILKKDGKVDKVLVVCPVSMIDKWVLEFEQWDGNIEAIGLKYDKNNKKTLLLLGFEAVVCNYETVITIKDELHEWVTDRTLIILDEFTKIKNPVAKRTKAILELGRLTKYKDILSGSPITQHAYDIFSPYLFLDNGETFGLNYETFINTYFWREGYRIIAARGSLEQIGDKMYKSATRFRKKECIDIPDKIYTHRVVELPEYNAKKYKEMVNWCITQINESQAITAPVILTQLLRLSQITSGFAKDVAGNDIDFEENPKLEALRDIFEESNGSSIVVWCRFQHDVENIAKLCKEMNISYVELYGETKPDERTKNIKAFQEGKAKVIVGTAGTGGHGIDLTTASVVVYYSNSYSLEQRIQSEDRAHRAGQKNQVTYIDILCKATIDYSIYKILRDKKKVSDIVTKDNIFNMAGGRI